MSDFHVMGLGTRPMRQANSRDTAQSILRGSRSAPLPAISCPNLEPVSSRAESLRLLQASTGTWNQLALFRLPVRPANTHESAIEKDKKKMDNLPTYVSNSPYLQSFISKTLRITTTDTRMFVGELKCTDKDKNLIITKTHEYRYPSEKDLLSTAARTGADSSAKLKVTMRSRFIGLVVIPGEHIVKVEVEDVPAVSGVMPMPSKSPLAV